MSIIWRENNNVITDPVFLGELAPSETSVTKSITVQHDLSSTITECGLFISPIKEEYKGSRYAVWDYDQIIWYGNNYPDYGLALEQSYLTSGITETYDGDRLVDTTRTEPVDIFAGATIEILDGPFVGDTTTITDYNVEQNFFNLDAPFSGNVTGSQYKIIVETTDYIKKENGSSPESPILLLNKGGVIERGDIVDLNFFMKVPDYGYAAAKLLVNFNLKYFSIEE